MKINQRKSGTILSYIQMIESTLIGLAYTPVMLRLMGQSEYGLNGTASGLTSFLSLLSFGLSGAYIKHVMAYRVSGDKEGENRLNGIFTVLYSFFSVLVVIAGTILIFASDNIFGNSLNEHELHEIKWIMFLTIINYVITFIFNPVMMFIQSHEKFWFFRIVAILINLVNPVVNIVALTFFPYSITVSISTLLFQIITVIVYFIYAYFKLNMRFSFRHLEFSVFKSVFLFSAFLFLNEITNLITNNTDRIVLSVASGTIAVAIYSVGTSFTSFFGSFSTSISGVFAPSINRIIAQSKVDNTDPDPELNKLFLKVGRLQFIVLTLAVIGFSSIGYPFIVLWAGEEYSYSYWIALLLMLTPYIPFIQNTGLEIQRAKNMHKTRSIVYFIVALFNIALTIPAAYHFSRPPFTPGLGGIAAAFATFISVILGQVVFMNVFYQKKVGVDVINFWKNILRMIPGMLIPLAVGLLMSHFVYPDSWIKIIIEGIIIVVVYSVSVYLFSMNRYERDLFTSPIKNFFRKIFKSKKVK